MAKIDVNVPDIGDFKDVPVIEMLVKPGDIVTVDQPLITLESDKATMDVPSPVAGKVAEVVAKVGDKVSMGALVARIESARARRPRPLPPRPPPRPQAAPAKAAAPAPAKAARQRPQGRGDRRHGPRHRRFQGRAGHRDPGQGGRHGRGRAAARHARIRQGDDGRAVAGRRQGRGDRRQGRRQSVDGLGDREARRRRIGCADRLGPGRRGRREGRGGRRRGARNLARRAERLPPRPPKAAAGPAHCRISPAFSPGRPFAGWRANSGSTSTDQGDRREWPHHPRGREGGAGRRRRGAAARRRRRRAACRSDGRLREIRSDRERSALAHQEDLRPAPARLVGQHSACHAYGRSRHHRARRLPQDARRGREERQIKALPRVAAAASDEGGGLGAEGLPDLQLRFKSRRRTP